MKLLFLVHGILTSAAAIVLLVWPAAIPAAVDISLNPGAYLLAYLLGASELGLAVLSFGAMRIADRAALRLIVWSFIVLHMATAVWEVIAIGQGVSGHLWANVALRLAVSALFGYCGLIRKPKI